MKLLFHMCIAAILGALTCTTASANQQIVSDQRIDLDDAWRNECFAKWNAGRVFCWSAYDPPAGYKICNFRFRVNSRVNGGYIFFQSPDEIKVRETAEGSNNWMDRWGGSITLSLECIQLVPAKEPRAADCFQYGGPYPGSDHAGPYGR
jgi:hypothetical protein